MQQRHPWRHCICVYMPAHLCMLGDLVVVMQANGPPIEHALRDSCSACNQLNQMVAKAPPRQGLLPDG